MRFILNLLIFVGLISCSSGDKEIDQLIIAFDNSPRSFDPRFAVDANSQYLTNLLHCSVIEYNAEGGYDLMIAESLEWKSDLELKITLKDKMNFSNGKPVTATDVKATFDFFINHPTETPIAASFKDLKEIELLSARELIFKFHKVDASFIVNTLGIGILPSQIAGQSEMKEPSEINGCGPYQLTSFGTTEIKLKKNPKFFLKNRIPRKDELIIKIVKDEGTRFLKLQKGEIHLSQDISREKIIHLKEYPKLRMEKRLGLNTAYIAFNMKDPVTSNQKVREAIAYAIDKESLIKYILADMAKPADHLLTPSSPFYHHDIPKREFNIEKAKELLTSAGYPDKGDAPRLTLSYKTTTDRTRVTIAKAIASQLSKIGIEVNLQTLEWGKFKEDVDAGRAQMWSLKWVGFKDPDILYYAFHSSNFTPTGGNRGFYKNEQLDKILMSARSINDIEQRKKYYFEAQEILNHDLPYINLWHEEVFAVINNSLTGYEVFADGRYQSLPLVREK